MSKSYRKTVKKKGPDITNKQMKTKLRYQDRFDIDDEMDEDPKYKKNVQRTKRKMGR